MDENAKRFLSNLLHDKTLVPQKDNSNARKLFKQASKAPKVAVTKNQQQVKNSKKNIFSE